MTSGNAIVGTSTTTALIRTTAIRPAPGRTTSRYRYVTSAQPGEVAIHRSTVSVVMPVCNNARFLAQAIESIAAQSLQPDELIVGDDGSSDGSSIILAHLANTYPFLKVLRRKRPSGVANAANWVVTAAIGDLIAVTHADDLSFPDRLERQVATLTTRPEAVLVGAPAIGIDTAGRSIHPANLWRITHPSAFAPFTHSSIMFRRKAFEHVRGYRDEANYWEDLDLFWRLSTMGELLVLPYPLTAYRYSDDSIRTRDDAAEVEAAINRMYGAAAALSGQLPDGSPDRKRQIRPRVFIARSWSAIWRAQRPGTLSRLLRHGNLRFDRQTLLALAFVCSGQIAPRSLRMLIQLITRARNCWAIWKLRSDEPVPWRPINIFADRDR